MQLVLEICDPTGAAGAALEPRLTGPVSQAEVGANGANGAGALSEADTGPADAQREPRPPERLSPSGASVFEQCPRRWRFRYVDKLPDPPGRSSLVGTFTHRVLELLLNEPADERTVDKARNLARSEWEKFSGNGAYAALELDDSEALDFRWQAWNAIEGLWTLEDPGTVEVKATEAHVSTVLGEVPFRGVLDRLEAASDGLVVTDYKSGRAPSPKFAGERLHQVMLYAAAVAADTGHVPARARLYYLGQKVVETPVTDEGLSGAIEQHMATWYAIAEACKSDMFEPRPGRLCDYCSFLEHCPAGQDDVARRAAERAAEEESLLLLAASSEYAET